MSELAGRTSQLANESGFFQKYLPKNHPLCAYYSLRSKRFLARFV